jgi:hypothetical protein
MNIPKLVAAVAVIALLLPGLLLISNIPTASAATSQIGRVTVSGSDILVDGVKPTHPFYGVCDTTALAFAIDNYINGNHAVAGWTSVFNGPDTSGNVPVTPNDTPDKFWNQYFAQMKYYGVNLVRIGAADTWGTAMQYNAWMDHREQYYDLLHSMSYYASANGVYLCFVVAGAQEYPTNYFGGSGSVFDPYSSAFAGYVTYAKATMVELENENAIAMYDLFNEPDHNLVNANYWHGNKVQYNIWSNAVADATAGVSSHPRTMGVAGYGNLFGMTQEDFNLATGNTRFEILHRHYYGSNADPYNFQAPEQWADAVGKPLLWGELANNGPYPLVRYTFGEQAIWAAGGQAITSMVLTGTSGYPYYGGVVGKGQVPMPTDWPVATTTPVVTPVTTTPASTSVPSTVVANSATDGSVTIEATAKDGGYTFTYTSDVSSDKIASVHWDFGDGAGSNETSPQHSFASGEHLVTLSLTATNGTVLMSTYAVDGAGAARSGAPNNGPSNSIAGAIAWSSSDSILMVVALASASVIGLLGYMGMVKGIEIPISKFDLSKVDPRKLRGLDLTISKLPKFPFFRFRLKK